MNILLLSAYDAVSHRHWHESLQLAFPAFDWTILTLPPRYFSWRIRGNSLSWAFGHSQLLERHFDLLIATSMVDLSALRGFKPALGQIPTLVYFHENQFVYPASGQQFNSIEPQVLNLYTALAADKIAFNSHYNRDSFLVGARDLLARFPDQVPSSLVERLDQRSCVIPVPLSNVFYQPVPRFAKGPLQVLWNHRWEYDKGPDRLLAVVRQLSRTDLPVRLHIVGQQFRQLPGEFDAISQLIEDSPSLLRGYWGYMDELSQYRQLLGEADVVLSTAIHDFQGLSVLEAVAAGCVPLVPDRLCYGEWFDSSYTYPSNMGDIEAEAAGVVSQLSGLCEQKRQGQLSAPSVTHLGLSAMTAQYAALFDQVIAARA